MGHQVVREYVYALTTVNPQEGRIFSLVLPWVDAEGMSIFLKQTAQVFDDEFCLMLLDGAGWHRANDLRIPKTMRLIFLPPYSPELNPVEHVWEYLRENVFGNLVFETLDDVMELLCQGLKSLSQLPHLVKSLTCFDWIKTLSMT